MVGFGLEADSANEAVDRFYSTVLKTPTSIQGISDAMKNSTAAFSTLRQFTSKTGDELEDYSQKLLNLSTAMTGQFALLGVQSSKSGTLTRNLMSRMLAVTDSAKDAFDELGLTVDGTLLTFDKFSRIAANDVTEALDLLTSQMSILEEDKDVLRKMFTVRQWTQITNILKEINGDTDDFIDRMSKGKSTVKGFETQMQSFSNQVKELQNNFKEFKGDAYDIGKVLATGLVPVMNKLLDALTKFGSTTGAKTTTTFLAMGTAISGVVGILRGLYTSMMSVDALAKGWATLGATMFNPWTLAISGLIAGFTSLYFYAKKARAEQQKIIDDTKELRKRTAELKKEMKESKDNVEKYNKAVKAGLKNDPSKPWRATVTQLDKVLEKFGEYKDLSDTMSQLSKVDFSILEEEAPDLESREQVRENYLRSRKESLEEYNKLQEELNAKKKEEEKIQSKLGVLNLFSPEYKKTFDKSKNIAEEIKEIEKNMPNVSKEYTEDLDKRKNRLAEIDNLLQEIDTEEQNIKESHGKAQEQQISNADKYIEALKEQTELFKMNTAQSIFKLDPSRAQQYKEQYAGIFDEMEKRASKAFQGFDKLDVLKSSAFQDLQKRLLTTFKMEDNLITQASGRLVDLGVSYEEVAKKAGISGEEISKVVNDKDLSDSKKQANLLTMIKDALPVDAAKAFNEVLDDNTQIQGENRDFILDLVNLLEAYGAESENITNAILGTDDATKEFKKTVESFKTDGLTDIFREFNIHNTTGELEKLRKEIKYIDEDLSSLGKRDKNIFEYNSKLQELRDFITDTKSVTEEDGNLTFTDEDDLETYNELIEGLGIEEDQVKEVIELIMERSEKEEEINEIYADRKEDVEDEKQTLRGKLKTLQGTIQAYEDIGKKQKELLLSQRESLKEQLGYEDSKEGTVQTAEDELAIIKGRLSKEKGIKELSKTELKDKLEELGIDENRLDLLIDFVENETKIKELNENKIEQYEKQYELMKLMNESAKFFGDMLGKDISTSVTAMGNIFSEGGAIDKFNIAKEAGNTEDKLSAGADIAMNTINAFDSVYDQILGAEISKIDKDISVLEQRKELAQTEEERARLDKQILDKQKAQIDLQMKQKTSGMISGGMAQGAGLGATLGSAVPVIGTVLGAAAGGILGGITGIFGQSKAEKQAEYQKKMLDEQITQNEILGSQEKLQSETNSLLANADKYGIQTAKQSFDFASGIGKGKSNWKRTQFKTWWKTWKKTESETGKYTIKAAESMSEYKNNIKKAEKYATSLRKKLEGGGMSDKDRAQVKADLDATTTAINNSEKVISKYGQAIEKVSRAWEGFTTIKNSEGNEVEVWATSAEIFARSIENAKEGINDIGSIVQNQLSNTFLDNLIKGDNSPVQDNIDNLEKMFKNASDWILNTEIPQKRTTLDVAHPMLKKIVDETEALEKNQEKINENMIGFNNNLLDAGAKISNIKNYLIPGLYDEMSNVFRAETYADGIDGLTDYLFEKLSASRIKETMDSTFSKLGGSLNMALSNAVSGNNSIQDILSLRGEFQQFAVQAENERRNIQTMKDVLSTNREIEYQSADTEISYETGTTKNIVYNNYNNITVGINDSIGFSDEAGTAIANKILPFLEEAQTRR